MNTYSYLLFIKIQICYSILFKIGIDINLY